MRRKKTQQPSNVVRLAPRADANGVTLVRETELLLEIARALAREAARDTFERAIAEMNRRAPENTE